MLDRPLSELSFDTILGMTVGFLLVVLGIIGFIFNNLVVAALQNILIFAPLAGMLGYFFGFWLAVVGVIVIVILIATHTITGARLKKELY